MTDETKPVVGFAEQMFEYHRAESNFTDALCDHIEDFDRISGDYYDCSLEIMKVSNDARLNEAAQQIIFDAGFVKVYVNHKDGWETHYSWGRGPFKAARGWRRRYVSDPEATTTNVVAGDPNPGYYEISYWPEGWSNSERTSEWLSSGYMRIVDDPLDPGDPVSSQKDSGNE